MPLTDSEKLSFSAQKLAQLNRASNAHLDSLIVLDTSAYVKLAGENDVVFDGRKINDAAAHRAKVIGRLANMTVDQLRARINIKAYGKSGFDFHADSDYTDAEKHAISLGYKSNIGRKWGSEIPAILAHKAEMEADGLSAAMVKAILKSR